MKRLFVADRAKADIHSLREYTEAQWGIEQQRRYLHGLFDRMRQLRHHPRLGRPRDDLRAGLRSLISGSHMIYYRETEDLVVILRVLHVRMDVSSRLTEPTDEP